MSVADLVPRVRVALGVSDSYDAEDIPALIRRQIVRLLRDYNFPKAMKRAQIVVPDATTTAYALPAGFKREALVNIYDPVGTLTSAPLKKREGFIGATLQPDYYWLQGQNIVVNAGFTDAGVGMYLMVYYLSMDYASNEDWMTADLEDVLFTLSVYRGATEFRKPDVGAAFAPLWQEDQRSIAIYANELEFGGIDAVMGSDAYQDVRYDVCNGVGTTGDLTAYGALSARVSLLEAGSFNVAFQADYNEEYDGPFGTGTHGAPRLFFGGLVPSGDDSVLCGGRHVVGVALFSHFSRDESLIEISGAGAYTSYDAAITILGADYSHSRGFQWRPTLQITGTIDEMAALSSQAVLVSGHCNLMATVHAYQPTVTGGSVGVLAGMYVETLSGGTIGTWGFYIVSNNCYIGGSLRVDNGLIAALPGPYADHAAAVAAGLVPNALYRTADGTVKVVY